MGNFLNTQASGSFSRRTQFYGVSLLSCGMYLIKYKQRRLKCTVISLSVMLIRFFIARFVKSQGSYLENLCAVKCCTPLHSCIYKASIKFCILSFFLIQLTFKEECDESSNIVLFFYSGWEAKYHPSGKAPCRNLSVFCYQWAGLGVWLCHVAGVTKTSDSSAYKWSARNRGTGRCVILLSPILETM